MKKKLITMLFTFIVLVNIAAVPIYAENCTDWSEYYYEYVGCDETNRCWIISGTDTYVSYLHRYCEDANHQVYEETTVTPTTNGCC